MTTSEKLRFPIGHWMKKETYSQKEIIENMQILIDVPLKLSTLTERITPEEESLTYREGSWTVREVVNHMVDSHINSYIRFKLAATESTPTIKPYDENVWALTNDYKSISVEDSVLTIKLIHNRMIGLFDNWTKEDWSKEFYHPGRKETLTVAQNLGLYAWHSKHHLAHIQIALGILQID